jgi:hypothetical protein
MCDNTDCIDDWDNTAVLANTHSPDNKPDWIKLLHYVPSTSTDAIGRESCKFAYGDKNTNRPIIVDDRRLHQMLLRHLVQLLSAEQRCSEAEVAAGGFLAEERSC